MRQSAAYYFYRDQWIFDPIKLTLKEIRHNTATEDVNNVVKSSELQPPIPAEVEIPFVFPKLSVAQLVEVGLSEESAAEAQRLRGPDSIETMLFLDGLPQTTADILLSYITGSISERLEIEALMRAERRKIDELGSDELLAIEQASDAFIDFADLPTDKAIFEDLPFEDWMVYLHPNQKALVDRIFAGPARLRGVSGSGKTVVAVHRAREAARRNLLQKIAGKALFITFNKSLSELVSRLLKRLCTYDEFCAIEVVTHGSWCKRYLQFRTGGAMAWEDSTREKIWREVVARLKRMTIGLMMQALIMTLFSSLRCTTPKVTNFVLCSLSEL